jgi:hypothetical protein
MKHASSENVVSNFPELVTRIFPNNFRSKKGAACRSKPRPEKEHIYDLVAIVIVVVPIAIGMPPVAVFIPPAMPFVPAAFPRFVQFVPRMIRLPAVPAMMLDSLMELVIRFGDAPLALIVAIGRRPRHSHECKQTENHC